MLRNCGMCGQDCGRRRLAEDETRLIEIGRDWSRLDEIGRDWTRLVKIGLRACAPHAALALNAVVARHCARMSWLVVMIPRTPT
jgi:hypothetical protein